MDEGDDYLGHTVIVASRLADAAGAGEILVSSISEQLVQGSGGFTFGPPARCASRAWSEPRSPRPSTGRGEPVDPVVEWRAAGLYDPDDADAAERLALLEYLTDRGATIEQMVEAHRMGTLPGVAGDLVTRGRTDMVTLADVAERDAAFPPHASCACLLAAGIPAADGTEVPLDLVAFMAAFEQGAALMGEEAILAFTRVLGAAANNVAEAAIALFFAEFGPGTVREGPDELARARLSEAATTAFTAVPEVLAQLVLDAFERAQRRAQAARSWLAPGHSADDPTDSPTELVALGFVDLVGSTAWAQSLSLRDQSLALTRFESAAWTSAVLAGGRVIKMIGDEVFFVAPTAEAACRIGLEVCRAAGEDDGPSPGPGSHWPRARHAPRRRLLRSAGQSALPPREGGRPRGGRGHRGRRRRSAPRGMGAPAATTGRAPRHRGAGAGLHRPRPDRPSVTTLKC